MIRNKLPNMTEAEFKDVMRITTDDIRENRIKFGKRTNLQQMFDIALRSLKVLRSCSKAVELYFDGYTAKQAVNIVKGENERFKI